MNAMRITYYSTLYRRDEQAVVAHDIIFTDHGTIRFDSMGRGKEIAISKVKKIEQLEKSAWNE